MHLQTLCDACIELCRWVTDSGTLQLHCSSGGCTGLTTDPTPIFSTHLHNKLLVEFAPKNTLREAELKGTFHTETWSGQESAGS